MIVEGGPCIAPVTGDVDVSDLVIEGESVQRQVALEYSSIPSPFQPVDRFVQRLAEAAIEPDRVVANRARLGRPGQEHSHDPLGPGRSAFRVSRDDDVVPPRTLTMP